MIKSIFSFFFFGTLLYLFFHWLMPVTTERIVQWGVAEVSAVRWRH
jgi:hypothetical protein